MNPSALLDVLRDPQMRHAAVVHFPVALSILALLLALASAFAGAKNRTLRWTTAAAYALLIGVAVLGVQSGDAAEEETGVLSAKADDMLEEHEEMAEKVWIFALGTLVLAAGTALPRRGVRVTAAWLAAAGGLATAGWVGVTAHHGGSLVYEYGVGTPRVARPAPASDSADPRVVFFTGTVRPLLEEKCMRCHHPGKRKLPGGLDQTSIATILRGGKSGPAVVPGQPDESLMIKAVRWESPDLEMPPDDDDRLSDEEVGVLVRWVREGAVWD